MTTTTSMKQLCVVVAAVVLAACGGEKAPATLKSLQVTPPTPVVAKGLSVNLRAVAVYSDATTKDVTAEVAWNSSDAAVATVEAGRVVAVVQGSASIKATYQAVEGAASVTVSDAALLSMVVSAGETGMPKGTSLQLKADGFFSDGTQSDVTAQAAWSCPDAGLQVIGTGLVSGAVVGSTRAVATLAGVSAELPLVVSDALLLDVRFVQADPTVPVGLETKLALEATYSDGSSRNVTADATLVSTDENIMTVTAEKAVRGVSTGTAFLAANLGDRSALVAVDVTRAQVVSMRIAPEAAAIAKGAAGSVQAIALLTDATEAPVTSRVTWSSSDETVALADNADGLKGTFYGVAAGTATLTAFDAETGTSASIVVTVSAPTLTGLAITESSVSLVVGTTHQLTVNATYSDGSTKDVTSTISWYDLFPGVVDVSGGAISASSVGATVLMAWDPTAAVAPAYVTVNVHN